MKRKKPPKVFTYNWIFEPLERDPGFEAKRMFGCLAAYLHGRMVLVIAEDPGDRTYRGKDYGFDIWDGVMLPTDREYHSSLKKEFKDLVEHPVLGKWLYLPSRTEDFESLVREISQKIVRGDPRFGIDPKIKVDKIKASKKNRKGRV